MIQFIIFGFILVQSSLISCSIFDDYDYDNYNDIDDNYNNIEDNYNYQQNVQPYVQTYQKPAVQRLPYPFLKESQNYFIQPNQHAAQQNYNPYYVQSNDVEPDSEESISYEDYNPYYVQSSDVEPESEEGYILDEDSNENFIQQDMEQAANIRRRRSASVVPYVKKGSASRTKRQSDWLISECTREECRKRGNGWRGLEQCGPAYCTCQNGHAYLQGCGIGLIYHAEKRLCTWYYNVPGC